MQDLYPGRLLCSRLCHDLITPVGAILSGLELLEENQDGNNQDIIDLLRLSTSEAARRLTLLRFCFGVGAAGSMSCLNDIEATLKKSIDTAKFQYKIDLPPEYLAGAPHLATWGQLLANMFSLSIDALPYGGDITIASTGSVEPHLEIRLKGRLVTIPEEIKQVAHSGASHDQLTPRTIQAYLIWRLSQEIGRRISVAQRGEEVYVYTQAA